MSGPWSLAYDGYDPGQEGLREVLCALGNGYFCSRAAAPDSQADGVHYPGTYLAGGYDRLTTEIKGREIENEDLVNLPNWLVLEIRIDDGPWLRPDEVEYLDYAQELDLARGILHRRLRFRDGSGRVTRWVERRLVSMADQHVAGLEVTIVPEDWTGPLHIRSGLDGTVVNSGVERYRELNGRHLETVDRGKADAETVWLTSRTVQSRIEITEAARTRVFAGGEPVEPGARQSEVLADLVAQVIDLEIDAEREVRVEKIVAVYTSRDHAISEAGLAAREKVAGAGSFDELAEAHATAWAHLWEQFDLGLDLAGEAALTDDAQVKLRVHLFHLLQTVSQHSIDRDVGVPPRGWHGEAYRAHIMWDELFIFPLLNWRYPVLTRALLRYRYHRLPAARRLARDAGYRGAMFPWQSGSSGREESQVLHLNPQSGRWIPDDTNRQRHIGSAVAYNVWHYYEVTGDREFLRDYGAEMLVEIARFWASIAEFDQARDRYVIRGVMGPDEFHTGYPGADREEHIGLDNNAYTNVLAAWVLNRARDVLELIPPCHGRRLCDRLGLADSEIEAWDEISRKLFVPFHDGVISQFEGYETLEEFDWAGYRETYGDIQRLDRILEAEGDTPNRYKASKQADVLMLFYLFSADELRLLFEQLGYPFDPQIIPDTIDYYLQRTSHGSTLSRVVHSWVLARANRQQSWRLFQSALDSDIADIQGGTTPEGIHLGAMAGTVDLMQRCYTGIETRGDALHFNPSLPDGLERLRARLRYRGQEIDFEITHRRLRIHCRQFSAAPVTVAYRGRFRQLGAGATQEFHVIGPAERDRSEPPPNASDPAHGTGTEGSEPDDR